MIAETIMVEGKKAIQLKQQEEWELEKWQW